MISWEMKLIDFSVYYHISFDSSHRNAIHCIAPQLETASPSIVLHSVSHQKVTINNFIHIFRCLVIILIVTAVMSFVKNHLLILKST